MHLSPRTSHTHTNIHTQAGFKRGLRPERAPVNHSVDDDEAVTGVATARKFAFPIRQHPWARAEPAPEVTAAARSLFCAVTPVMVCVKFLRSRFRALARLFLNGPVNDQQSPTLKTSRRRLAQNVDQLVATEVVRITHCCRCADLVGGHLNMSSRYRSAGVEDRLGSVH